MKNKVIIKIKKKLYNVVALPALKNIFRILPIAKNKIVFDNFCGKGYGGNPKYIAEAILESNVKGLDMIWLVDNFMPDEERKIFPNNIRLVSYTIRILPLTLIRKPIKNQFIQSFLYYVPYVTLSVMTFPAIVHATQSPVSGALALVVGIAAAWFGANLFQVSVACCAVVFVIELFL